MVETARRATAWPAVQAAARHRPYILDFYCAVARLAVEVDGSGHDHPQQFSLDQRRTAWLSEEGVSVLRYPARLILDDEALEGVLRSIAQAAGVGSSTA